MDEEIEHARAAGIDYWAFVAYPRELPMSRALSLYLASPKRTFVNFALISEVARWGGPAHVARVHGRFVELMKEPTYQKVLDNRPLFYLGFIDDTGIRAQWGSEERFSDAVQSLRRAAINAGLGNPYIVVMDFSPRRGNELRLRFGFDAVTTYATHGNAKMAPYSELRSSVRFFLERLKTEGAPVIPIAMAGWDRRPRVQTPAPWERDRNEPADAIDRYYEAPLPHELADHIQEVLWWAARNRATVEANAILVYAWNEHDEGGWIAPTLLEGDARVRAIGAGIRSACALETR